MRLIYLWIAGLTVLISSCFQSNEELDAATRRADSLQMVSYSFGSLKVDSSLFDPPIKTGVIHEPDLFEASGLAPSRRNPGYLWLEEDSGNPNEIQLVSPGAMIMARFTIDGVGNRDWEDIEIGTGPIPNKPYIYLAEIGDNKFRHSEKVIYRFPEPSVVGQKLPYDGNITNVEAIRLQLPDGSRNAEAILIDPDTNDLFILTKGERSVVYKAAYPQSLTQPNTMTRQLVLPFKDVTSADVSPDGREILIRTYEQFFYYNRQSGETIIDALKRAPRRLPMTYEPQGEAIGWQNDGSGYYATSEKANGISQKIFWYPRKLNVSGKDSLSRK